jgi:leucyl/phenylalanyl-tRNA--protein transferase
MGLVEVLTADGRPGRLIDVQWQTDHLASLGVIEIDRAEYLARLGRTLTMDGAVWAMTSGR